MDAANALKFITHRDAFRQKHQHANITKPFLACGDLKSFPHAPLAEHLHF
jgi:hypothetical protein